MAGDQIGWFSRIDLAHVDLARGGNTQNSMAAVSAEGSTICDAPRHLFMLQYRGNCHLAWPFSGTRRSVYYFDTGINIPTCFAS